MDDEYDEELLEETPQLKQRLRGGGEMPRRRFRSEAYKLRKASVAPGEKLREEGGLRSDALDAGAVSAELESSFSGQRCALAVELDRQRELNIAPLWKRSYYELWPLVQSLAHVLHHRDAILERLLLLLAAPSPPCKATALQLAAVMAKDLQEELLPAFPKLSKAILTAVDVDDAELSTKAFETLGYVLRFLAERSGAGKLPALLTPLYGPFLGHSRDYIRKLAAQTFSIALRKVGRKAFRRHVVGVLKAAARAMTDNLQETREKDFLSGLGELVFSVVKTANKKLHSRSKELFSVVFPLIVEEDGGAKRASQALARVAFAMGKRLIDALVNQAHPKESRPVWDALAATLMDGTGTSDSGTSAGARGRSLQHSLDLLVQLAGARGGVFVRLGESDDILHRVQEELLNRVYSGPETADGTCVSVLEFCALLWLSRAPIFRKEDVLTQVLRGLMATPTALHKKRLLPELIFLDRVQAKISIDGDHAMLLRTLLGNLEDTSRMLLVLQRLLRCGFLDDGFKALADEIHEQGLDEATADKDIPRSIVEASRSRLEDVLRAGPRKVLRSSVIVALSVYPTCLSSADAASLMRQSAGQRKRPKKGKPIDAWDLNLPLGWSAGADDYVVSCRALECVSRVSALATSKLLGFSGDLRKLLSCTAEILRRAVKRSGELIETRRCSVLAWRAAASVMSAVEVFRTRLGSSDVIHPDEYLEGLDKETEAFEALLGDGAASNLRSGSHWLRLYTLEVCTRLAPVPWRTEEQEPLAPGSIFQGRCRILEICLEIEKTPLAIDNERIFTASLNRLEMWVASGRVPTSILQMLAAFCVGLLHVKFSPIWGASAAVLAAVVETTEGLDLCSALLGDELRQLDRQRAAPQIEPQNEDVQSMEDLDASVERQMSKDDGSIPWITDESGLLLCSDMRLSTTTAGTMCKDERTDGETHFRVVWGALARCPKITMNRSRQVVPVILSFFHVQYFRSANCYATTLALDDKASDDGFVMQNVKLTSSELRARLLAVLGAVEKVTSPKSMYKAELVKACVEILLQRADPKVAKQAFLVLLRWRSTALTNHRKTLLSLLETTSRLREALLKFRLTGDEQTVTPSERGELVPVLVRLLFGRLSARSGSVRTQKESPAARRAAILAWMAQLGAEELEFFIGLVLRPLLPPALLKREIREIHADEELRDYVVPPEKVAQVAGFLHLLKDIVSKLGYKVAGFLPIILRVLIGVTRRCAVQKGVSIGAGESDEGQAKAGAAIGKDRASNLRVMAITRLCGLIEQFGDDFDFSPYIADFLRPLERSIVALPETVADVSKTPALVRLGVVMADSSHTANSLVEASSLVAALIASVSTATQFLIVQQLLRMFDKLLEMDISNSPIRKHLPLLLEHLSRRLSSSLGSKVGKLAQLELAILCRVSEAVTEHVDADAQGLLDAASVDTLVQLLLPHLAPKLDRKGASTDEEAKFVIIRAYDNLLPMTPVSAAIKYLRLLGKVLGPSKNAAAGEQMSKLRLHVAQSFERTCARADALVDQTDNALLVHFGAVAECVVSLNAYDPKDVNSQRDLDTIVEGLNALAGRAQEDGAGWASLLQKKPNWTSRLAPASTDAFYSEGAIDGYGSLVAPMASALAVVVGICIHFVGDAEVSLRIAAFAALSSLTSFVKTLQDNEGLGAYLERQCWISVLSSALLPNLKAGLSSKSEAIQQASFKLLGAVAAAFPDRIGGGWHGDLHALRTEHDDELDNFFVNVYHIQIHRRARALSRLRSLLASQDVFSPSTVTKILLPLSLAPLRSKYVEKRENYLKEAAKLVGAVCRHLSWPQYVGLIRNVLQQLRRFPNRENQLVTTLRYISENFTFDVVPPAEDEDVAAEIDGETQEQDHASGTLPTKMTTRAGGGKQKDNSEGTDGNDEEEDEDEDEDEDGDEDDDDKDNKDDDKDTKVHTDDAKDGAGDGDEAGEDADEVEDAEDGNGSEVEHDSGDAKDAIQLRERVWQQLNRRILPEVQRAVTKKTRDKSNTTIHVCRAPVAYAYLNFIRVLPESSLRLRLPNLLLVLCSQLKLRDVNLRDQARKVLGNVASTLGPKYLRAVVGELASSLTEGYQLHVRGYTLHTVLKAVAESYSPPLDAAHLWKPATVDDGIDEQAQLPELPALDTSVGDVVSLLVEDIVGKVGMLKEMRNVDATSISSMREAKGIKAYDALEILSSRLLCRPSYAAACPETPQSVSAVHAMLSPLLTPLLDPDLEVRHANKLQEAIMRVARGLSLNPSFRVDEILLYTHATMAPLIRISRDASQPLCAPSEERMEEDGQQKEQTSETRRPDDVRRSRVRGWIASEAQMARTAAEARKRKLEVQRENVSVLDGASAPVLTGRLQHAAKKLKLGAKADLTANAATTAALRYAFFLLNAALKRRSEVQQQNSELADAFVPLLARFLNRGHAFESSVTRAACRSLTLLIPLELRSIHDWRGQLCSGLLSVMMKHSKTFETNKNEVVLGAFKALAALIADEDRQEGPEDPAEDVQRKLLNDKQFRVLLLFLQSAALEPDPEPATFTLVKSVVRRRLLTPEVYDLMDKVSKVYVQSFNPSVRSIATQIFVDFLITYPLTDKKLDILVKQLIANLEYQDLDGRISAMRMMSLLLKRLPKAVLDRYAMDMFLPIFVRLTSDNSEAVRKEAEEALARLLKGVGDDALAEMRNLTLSWLQKDKGLEFWRAGAQGAGLVFVYRTPSAKRADYPAKVLQSIFRLLSGLIAEPTVKSASEDWIFVYHSLVSVEKLGKTLPAACASLLAQPVRPDDGTVLPIDIISELLAYPHAWVRTAGARLWSMLLRGEASKLEFRRVRDLLSSENRHYQLVRRFVLQVNTDQELPGSLVSDAAENLAWLCRRFPPGEKGTEWLIQRMSFLCHEQKGMDRKIAVSRFFRCLCLPEGQNDGTKAMLEANLIPALHALIRLRNAATEEVQATTPARQPTGSRSEALLAEVAETLERLERCVGSQHFVQGYAQVGKALEKKRAEKKRKRAIHRLGIADQIESSKKHRR